MANADVATRALADRQPQEERSSTPVFVVEPRTSAFHVDLAGLWQHRELLYFLVWREVKVRYKQTAIGAAWAVGQPLLTMTIFTVIFGMFARIPSDGVPYPLFAYAALIPWTYFSEAITRSGGSLVTDANLLRKVYFPRLVIPIASVVTPIVDFGASLLLLFGLMAWYGVAPGWTIAALPVFLLLALLTALAAGLWLSALNVRYRDVRYTIPFLTQVWMYASPVVYPVSLVPENWRLVYGLNPMAGVIEGFRWALLGSASPDFRVMAASAVVVVVCLTGGVVFFKRMEGTFADIV
jgi:lipopolysaccharide transport system permease protein